MTNELYERTVAAISEFLGARPRQGDVATGCRFASANKGKATVYHSNIAAGNRAEIAIEVTSFGRRLGLSQADATRYYAQLASVTGRPVQLNPTYRWPRVGIATPNDLGAVMAYFRQHNLSAMQ